MGQKQIQNTDLNNLEQTQTQATISIEKFLNESREKWLYNKESVSAIASSQTENQIEMSQMDQEISESYIRKSSDSKNMNNKAEKSTLFKIGKWMQTIG